MTRGVNQIEVINLAVFCFVGQRSSLRLNRNPALTLNVHRVQHLRLHFARGQATTHVNDAVCERGFAVVDVGDDGEVTNVFHGHYLV